MGLAEDLEAAAPTHAGDRCHACDRLAELPDGRDKQWLERALNEKRSPVLYAYGAKNLAGIARRNGLLLPEASIREHRNQGHGA